MNGAGGSSLVVVGGGITGLALAVHAVRAGRRVTLLEAGTLGGERSTQRSGALVRTHYPDAGSAALALRGLEHFEAFAARYGGEAGFVRTGFAYVPEPEEDLETKVARLVGVGIDTQVLSARDAAVLDPALDFSDVDAVAYEPRSGYASPALTCATLAAAAVRAGAELREHTPVTALLGPGRAALDARPAGPCLPVVRGPGVLLADGTLLRADQVVLCAGAASRALAATVGLDLPIRPTAVKLAFFRRAVPTHLAVIDAPNGTYLRPDGDGATLAGRRTWTDEPLADHTTPLPDVDDGFVAETRERLARRVPSAHGAPVVATRAGQLDMTPDGLPLVGPTAVDGLWLCCGWSGTGFKTGPSVGEQLAAWLTTGARPAELAGFAPDRELRVPAGTRSPH